MGPGSLVAPNTKSMVQLKQWVVLIACDFAELQCALLCGREGGEGVTATQHAAPTPRRDTFAVLAGTCS